MRLLTQTDVVRFLLELSRRGAPALRELFSTSLERLGIGECAGAETVREASHPPPTAPPAYCLPD